MANLGTSYLGLELDNPFIVGSCGLTRTPAGVESCAEAGAGAVVLKSLFEEQIRVDYAETVDALADSVHPEALAYLQADLASRYGPRNYLDVVKRAAKAVSIPVIASVNCTSTHSWIEFAKQLEAAGAAALELNIFVMPIDPEEKSGQVDQVYLDIVSMVTDRVKMPVAVKLAPYITNLPRLGTKLAASGARGLVLFNRLFTPDIDIEKEEVTGGISLSHPEEHLTALRWVALLSEVLDLDICGSRGIHDAGAAVKMLLAGATAVQVTSTLYINKVAHLRTLVEGLGAWMDAHGHKDLDAFRGNLSMDPKKAALFQRAQYIKAFVGVE
jgi:dihydroorotate dehydrogenase (fumarate)